MWRLYDFQCTNCNYKFERIVRDGEKPACPLCHQESRRIPNGFNINMGVGAYGYYDDQLEMGISTNRQKREVMRQKGVTPKGATPKPDGDAWV